MLKLRDYQEEAIKKTYEYLKSKKGNAPIIEVFTGGGKSLIMAQIMIDMVKIKRRVLCVTHVQELVQQNHDELKVIAPDIKATIYSNGLKKKDMTGDVVFASVQSIQKNIHKGEPFNVILIDECDLVSPNETTRYRQLIDTLKLMNPEVKIIGLTATPYRLDSGYIYGQDDSIFDGVSYQIGYAELLEKGYLCPIVTKSAVQSIDTSDVKKRGGEYLESDLARAATKEELVKSAVAEIVKYGHDRKSWLVFATGIKHAELLKDEFQTYGIDARCVNGTTPNAERQQLNQDFKDLKFKCLISVGTHTVGFNAPRVDLLALVRATLSTRLYVQIIGRCCRTHPEKQNALLLDFGNNVKTHGFLDALNIKEPKRKSQDDDNETKTIMAKECPKCQSVLRLSLRECPDCGYEYPDREFIHEQKAYDGAILSTQVEPTWHKVDKVLYNIHKRKGKPSLLRISHMIGLFDQVNEFLTLTDLEAGDMDHNLTALKIGRSKVLELGGKSETVQGAIAECHNWLKPKKIKVKLVNGYKSIIKKEF